jgi:3-dehydroquinate synthase
MNTLTLSVPRFEATSTVWVGRRLIGKLKELLPLSKVSSISVVADRGAESVLSPVLDALSLTQERVLRIQGGEHSKTTDELQALWGFFVEQRLDRKSLVVSVGGGATSDVVGFAAATFMRGVAVVNIPTTLLAQVDASIGGKTGINFGETKNLIGSIGQPLGVVVDVDTLATLPPRDFTSGFAEIVKHGLITDAAYFHEVAQKPCTSWTPDELVSIVLRSCKIKRAVVESDEAETGPRKTLNFGHTIGHALEALAMDTPVPLTHGEAVAIGMVAEAHLSFLEGRISERDYTTIIAGIAAVGLPTKLTTSLDSSEIKAAMLRDKKNSHGAIKWTLLDSIGHAIFDGTASEEHVSSAITAIQP